MPLFNEQVKWDQPAPEELLHAMIERVKAEIRRNRPVLVWHAFSNAEWDVVAGFDDERQIFLGRGSYQGWEAYAEASWNRPREAIHICPAMGAIFIGDKVGGYDAEKAEIDSLKAAVAHAHSQTNADKLGGSQWALLEGFLAYQRWINDFKNPQKKRDMGDAYCYGIYRSTHRAAADYLKEIALKHPASQSALREASTSFQAEADTLDRAKGLLWWDSPEGPDLQRNQQAAAILEQAFGHYQRGIQAIESAIQEIA